MDGSVELNVHEIYIYTIWTGACLYRINNVLVVIYFSLMTYEYC